jgi:hypothetical protein
MVVAFSQRRLALYVSLLSVLSFAVESLAAASLATAIRFTSDDLAGSPGIRPPSPSFGLDPAAPISDFFWIAISFTHSGPSLVGPAMPPTDYLAVRNSSGLVTTTRLSLRQFVTGNRAGEGLRGNNLAGGRLAGVNLRLGGLAGWGSGLLADERFLFDSHCGVSSFYLTALRSTLVQPGGQTPRRSKKIFKLLKTIEHLCWPASSPWWDQFALSG